MLERPRDQSPVRSWGPGPRVTCLSAALEGVIQPPVLAWPPGAGRPRASQSLKAVSLQARSELCTAPGSAVPGVEPQPGRLAQREHSASGSFVSLFFRESLKVKELAAQLCPTL